MPRSRHPLAGNEHWKFSQPYVGFRAHYVAVDRASGDKEVLTMTGLHTCREGVISNARSTFQTRLTNLNEVQKASWSDSKRPEWVITRDCDLVDPQGKQNPAQLRIRWDTKNNWPFTAEDFLKVCDVVLGPVAVLLGPWRPTGDNWWRTNPETALENGHGMNLLYWNGTDSWFLAHPATMAIALGLYRQCFQLCLAGMAGQILETVSEDEVAEVMSTNSQRLALILVKRTRPWIEVPVATNGHRFNYAFPMRFWRRLIRLQRAIRRYGYEESLGQSFHEGWATVGSLHASSWTGVYNFWGDEGELTAKHTHLMKMGAPRRRTRGKSASKAT